MSDTGPQTRAVTCERCGSDFTCRLGGGCWCADEPYRLPLPESGDCLCPACLRQAAARIVPNPV